MSTQPLEVALAIQGELLVLDYKFRNTRQQPVYLFNVLWDSDPKGKPAPAPSPVYVCLLPDGVLHLAKKIPKLPPNRKVELRVIPYATKVEPGREFSESLQLALPLAEYNPYFVPTPETKYEVRRSKFATFTLNLLPHSDGLVVEPAPLPNSLSVRHKDLFGKVETLSVKHPDVVVPVNKRLDAFEDI